MTFSLNEVETLVRKAALGTGLDPGRAAELAGAALWLTAANVPVFEIIHRALERDAGGALELAADGAGATCPATLAARIGPLAIDLLLAKASGFQIILETVDEPLIIIALAARASHREDTTFTIETPAATIGIQPGAMPNLSPLNEAHTLRLTRNRNNTTANAATVRRTHTTRYDPAAIPDNGFTHLDRLAWKTYVPASEQSRIAGAGAGLTDND